MHNTLTLFGRLTGTDKVDEHHTFMGERYTDIYSRYLEKHRFDEITFLEMGVREGKSIEMWSRYLKNAKIVGVDIDPSCRQYEGGNVKIEIGSQSDPDFINGLIQKYNGFDIVLDDASHINTLTMKSFRLLQEHTRRLYMIEDLRNSYEDLTNDIQFWPGMHLNKDLNPRNDLTRKDFDGMILSLIRDMDYRTGRYTGVHFHAQMLILEMYHGVRDQV